MAPEPDPAAESPSGGRGGEEARRAAEQERAGKPPDAGRQARDSVWSGGAHLTITSTSLSALPEFGDPDWPAGVFGPPVHQVPVITSPMCLPVRTPVATSSRLFGSRNAPKTANVTQVEG